MDNHEEFLRWIDEKRLLKITFDSNEKGRIERTVVPYDFWPSNKYNDDIDRYHGLTLDSPDWRHNLSIKHSQIIAVKVTDSEFDPVDYIDFETNWYYERDWWEYS